MKRFIRKILGIEEDIQELRHRVKTIEDAIFDKKAMINGFTVLKKNYEESKNR